MCIRDRYHTWDKCGEKYIDIPVYGYGACAEGEDKIIGRLFQYMAQNEVAEGITNFSVHIYAHDFSVRQLFSFMQFGTMSEICVRKAGTDHEKLTPYHIQNLTKSPVSYTHLDVYKRQSQNRVSYFVGTDRHYLQFGMSV